MTAATRQKLRDWAPLASALVAIALWALSQYAHLAKLDIRVNRVEVDVAEIGGALETERQDRLFCERMMERRMADVESAIAILPVMAQDVRDMRDYLLEGR